MAEKLFYIDAYMKEFTAEVISCTEGNNGWLVELDRTAFYPEGGGQPADTGILGGTEVTDVHEKDGRILHTCSAPLAVGENVTGRINWERRFDLMQQHSGEHIVSGIICSRFHCSNVGFHLGKDFITIDFDTELTWEQLREVEKAANETIWKNVTTEIFYPTPEELAVLPYRSKKELSGTVRIVRFPGADTCACCGTHVAHTGEIGLVKLFSCVRFRSGIRLEMMCGKRCFEYLSAVNDQNRNVSGMLSAKPLETAAAVFRLADENGKYKMRIAEFEKEHIQGLADKLAGRENPVLIEVPMSPDSVRMLCDAVIGVCTGTAFVFSGSDEEGWRYAIGTKNGDLRTICREMNAQLGGRGGGKPNFVQGSLSCTQKEIAAFLSSKI